MKTVDVVILTDARYVNPKVINDYVANILLEDSLVKEALEANGLIVDRINWDDPKFDWSKAKVLLFRTTWDYFDRFAEFDAWLKKVEKTCRLMNSSDLIHWNINKAYLKQIDSKGVRIPSTKFIGVGTTTKLCEIIESSGWKEVVLKPLIAGAARHTYRLNALNCGEIESIFQELIQNEEMMIQEFQHQILTKGEIALIFFGLNYSHAVLKKAKAGDFRVQDDFGGTIHDYEPSENEINFAIKAIEACPELPIYARVDIIWNNEDELCVSEIELIEPELWFRKNEYAAPLLAKTIAEMIT